MAAQSTGPGQQTVAIPIPDDAYLAAGRPHGTAQRYARAPGGVWCPGARLPPVRGARGESATPCGAESGLPVAMIQGLPVAISR
jgi:hypothetical protein